MKTIFIIFKTLTIKAYEASQAEGNILQQQQVSHYPLSSRPNDFLNDQSAKDKWVDKYQIMKEFGISERTLYNLRKKNEIPFSRLGKLVLYNRTRLEHRLRKLSGMMILIIQIIFNYCQEAGMAVEM